MEFDFTKPQPPYIQHRGRITREAMLLGICQVIRKRSSCRRGQVGCIIVKDSRIVSMGYNGAPPRMPDCLEVGCDDGLGQGCQRAIHAEANAIAWAARNGISTEDATMYCTHGPCPKCAQLIIACGIIEHHWIYDYRVPEGVELIDRANIQIFRHGELGT